MSEMDDWNRQVIAEFRANQGHVGGRFEGATIVLLHTTGARTGAERVNPLVALAEDGRVYVYASFGGAPRHPDWFHNLRAHPAVEVEIGTERYPATARVLEGGERDRAWDAQVRRHPFFGEYQATLGDRRLIPVVELVRA
jgi:deazaflavin-dependent oxidoreductase (nitroreductase family)